MADSNLTPAVPARASSLRTSPVRTPSGLSTSWEPPSRSSSPTPTHTNGNFGNNIIPDVQEATTNISSTPPNPSASSATREAPPFPPTLLPGGTYSLLGIATRAFILGTLFGGSVSLTIYLSYISSPLWRAPFFAAVLSLFHFLEYFTTALRNTRGAHTSAFLLTSNGRAYNAAHTLAMVETVVMHSSYMNYEDRLPLEWRPYRLALGLSMLLVGQVVRSVAMVQAGSNFNHTVQLRKADGHSLVTEGLYRWLRHPSYFGFFWWGLGSQIVLGNFMCFSGYALILWKFFSIRIKNEEAYLTKFFGLEYVKYRERTSVGIPFIS